MENKIIKEQKIERLKKEIKRLKREKKHIIADLEMFDNIINKKEKELKELEDGED